MTHWNSDWRVIGSQGTLRWDGGDSIQCQVLNPDGKQGFNRDLLDVEVPRPLREHGAHAAMIRNFVAALLHGEPLVCPCEDNIKSLAMVSAAVQSAKTGQKVPVQW